MTKDDRLYGKFTLDFADNPKILPLSDSAFRCLVEATLYSRRMLSDGFLASRLAVAKWGLEALQELATNDPSKPSLIEVEGGWKIHDYELHQDTREQVESRRRTNAANGSKGGIARAKQLASDPPSDSVSEIQAETETETETETSSSTKKNAANRGSRIDPKFSITDDMREWAAGDVPLVDLDAKLPAFIDYWASVPGAKGVRLDWVRTWRNGMRKQQEFAEQDAKKRPAASVDWMNR